MVICLYEDFFAERLAALREQKKISARAMSLAIGQNSSYINRIENKHAFPSMQCFFYICEYLEITPEEFFQKENNHPEKLNNIIKNMRSLDDKQLDNIAFIVSAMKK